MKKGEVLACLYPLFLFMFYLIIENNITNINYIYLAQSAVASLLLIGAYFCYRKNVDNKMIYFMYTFLILFSLFNLRDLIFHNPFGPDATWFMKMSQEVIKYGHLVPEYYNYHHFPGLFMFFSIIQNLSGITIEIISKIILLLFTLILSLVILIFTSFFNKISLSPFVAIMYYLTTTIFLVYQLSAQTLAYIISLVTLLVIIHKEKTKADYFAISILTLILFITHLLTPIFIIIFIILFYLSKNTVNVKYFLTAGAIIFTFLVILYQTYLIKLLSHPLNFKYLNYLVYSLLISNYSLFQIIGRMFVLIFISILILYLGYNIYAKKFNFFSVSSLILISSMIFGLCLLILDLMGNNNHFAHRFLMFLPFGIIGTAILLFEKINTNRAVRRMFLIFICLTILVVGWLMNLASSTPITASEMYGYSYFNYNHLNEEKTLLSIWGGDVSLIKTNDNSNRVGYYFSFDRYNTLEGEKKILEKYDFVVEDRYIYKYIEPNFAFWKEWDLIYNNQGVRIYKK